MGIKRASISYMKSYLLNGYQIALNAYFQSTDMEMLIHAGQVQMLIGIAKDFFNWDFPDLDQLAALGCDINAGL